ncbi:hypothetical protein IFM89_008510 [Coptis chinensis]|uniref:RNase H type-1 domain-containing protein n=1 Tax=Coptis chinensis TaxID=261450 RepID=A0A835LIP9_9MAGN|nr:hypothetical protein IFM89_008510 [Coptis chinensis]
MLNPDGTVQSQGAGYGVIRDKDGTVLLTYNGSSKCKSIMFQELSGILEGLKAAEMINIRQIEINSDSKRAVNIINSIEPTPWLCMNMLEAIKRKMSKFEKVETSHIFREMN